MNKFINLAIAGYCGWVIYRYFQGGVSPNILGIQVNEIIFLAFFGLIGLYSLCNVYNPFSRRR